MAAQLTVVIPLYTGFDSLDVLGPNQAFIGNLAPEALDRIERPQNPIAHFGKAFPVRNEHFGWILHP